MTKKHKKQKRVHYAGFDHEPAVRNLSRINRRHDRLAVKLAHWFKHLPANFTDMPEGEREELIWGE